MLVRTAPAMGAVMMDAAIKALRLHGFSAIRAFRTGERAVVTAELPSFGRFGIA
jgi:hypothetical protein